MMKNLIYIVGITLLAACGGQEQKAVEVKEVAVEATSGATEEYIATNSKAAFKVEGMVCSKGCAPKITEAIKAVEGVGKVCASYEKRVAFVKFDSTLTNKETLLAAINGIDGGGTYTATELTVEECKAVCNKHECTEKCKDGCTKSDKGCWLTRTCSKNATKCAKWKSKCSKSDKKCSKDSTSCAKWKSECKKKCAESGKICKWSDAKTCAPGCEKVCCAKSETKACEPGCKKECCAKK